MDDPPVEWQARLAEWLAGKHSGQVVLNVNSGEVLQVQFTTSYRTAPGNKRPPIARKIHDVVD